MPWCISNDTISTEFKVHKEQDAKRTWVREKWQKMQPGWQPYWTTRRKAHVRTWQNTHALRTTGKLLVNRCLRLPRPIPSSSPASCRQIWTSLDQTRCRRRPSAGSTEPRQSAAAPAGYPGGLVSLKHTAKTAFSFLALRDSRILHSAG